MANVIKSVLNADIFEVVPTNVYTSADLNYSNDNSRVSREHSDTSKRDVPLTNTKVENWESYDTIYIGYPLWWGIAAWPMNNFVKENDFTGKTIIPFCTSASSGFGKSDEPLKALDSKGVWKEGRRFGMSANENEIKTWVESMK